MLVWQWILSRYFFFVIMLSDSPALCVYLLSCVCLLAASERYNNRGRGGRNALVKDKYEVQI